MSDLESRTEVQRATILDLQRLNAKQQLTIESNIAEIRRLRAANEALRVDAIKVTESSASYRAENAELRRCLFWYGHHQTSCRTQNYPLLYPDQCDCGWGAALKKFPMNDGDAATAKEGE